VTDAVKKAMANAVNRSLEFCISSNRAAIPRHAQQPNPAHHDQNPSLPQNSLAEIREADFPLFTWVFSFFRSEFCRLFRTCLSVNSLHFI
jgi:hypothetical protein